MSDGGSVDGQYSVLTPERVSLQYDIAGVGSRGAAAVIDTGLQLVALIVLIVAATAGGALAGVVRENLGNDGDVFDAVVLGLILLSIFLITNGYFMLFEIIWSGQTPGKRIVGVRVMRENGYPLRPIDAVIRNLVRIVDWLPLVYCVGALTMLLNSRSKRLGDFASGTIVVRESRSPTMAARSSAAPATGFVLAGADATLVRDFLMRRASMHPAARARLAQRLAAAVCRRYSLPPEPDVEMFLERLGG